MNFLAIANPKTEAIDAVAPNAFFAPTTLLSVFAVLFFFAAMGMIWLIIRAGKNKNYGD